QAAQAALLFDWQNWWGIDYCQGLSADLDYVAQAKKYYAALWDAHIATDVVRPTADLSAYKLVIAPVLYMLRPGVADNLKAFVRAGGTLVTTFFSGLVDENDLLTLGGYPGELRDLLGIWVEEIDALLPDQSNAIVFDEALGPLAGAYRCSLLCDLLHLEGAHSLATYGEDFYAGRPALTVNHYGQGQAYHIASDPESRFVADLLQHLCHELGIRPPLEAPQGVEVCQRTKEGMTFTFVLNHDTEKRTVALPGAMRDLLTGTGIDGTIDLEPNDVLILRPI
ncbi:MAG: beta-galactosidase trimerization domain-containing protein, partial [Anaerolineae bacterium]|nr:beta-galactosidase trimerization domain-containing protein [Anaerolineae bacterium]